jgi:predicted ATPase
MRVKINIELNSISFNGELDLPKLTVIIGPNLSGKSVVLKCIYSSVPAPEKFNLGSYIESLGECQVEEGENFDYAVYIDVYAITYRIYEEVKDLMERYADKIPTEMYSILEKQLPTLSFLNDIRSLITDDEIGESREVVEKLLTEIKEKLKTLNLEEEIDYLEPLQVFPTKNRLIWKDFTGSRGEGVKYLSPTFYNAAIVTLMQYLYALSKKYKVLFILDEPEAFAHPSFAFFLGRLINKLTLESKNLFTICITHSWDFLQGIKNGAKVKVIRRRKDGKVEINEWNGEVYIPGFGVTGMLND